MVGAGCPKGPAGVAVSTPITAETPEVESSAPTTVDTSSEKVLGKIRRSGGLTQTT